MADSEGQQSKNGAESAGTAVPSNASTNAAPLAVVSTQATAAVQQPELDLSSLNEAQTKFLLLQQLINLGQQFLDGQRRLEERTIAAFSEHAKAALPYEERDIKRLLWFSGAIFSAAIGAVLWLVLSGHGEHAGWLVAVLTASFGKSGITEVWKARHALRLAETANEKPSKSDE